VYRYNIKIDTIDKGWGGVVGGEAISAVVTCSVTNDVIAVTSDVRYHSSTSG
jgi:hypothetical protein